MPKMQQYRQTLMTLSEIWLNMNVLKRQPLHNKSRCYRYLSAVMPFINYNNLLKMLIHSNSFKSSKYNVSTGIVGSINPNLQFYMGVLFNKSTLFHLIDQYIKVYLLFAQAKQTAYRNQ